jgi:NosR/NirI family nitrous oxide reductase transcriptional regulator
MRLCLDRVLAAATLVLAFVLFPGSDLAAGEAALDQVKLEQAQLIFPEAESLVSAEEDPITRQVYGKEELLGYLFYSDDLVPMPAYSGRPIRSLIGIRMDARIQGVIIVQHEEPILVIGITDKDISTFISQYQMLDAREKVRIGAHNRAGYTGVDGITGATITTMVLNSSIMKSARMVAEARGLPRAPEPLPRVATRVQTPSLDTVAGVRKTRPVTAAEEPLWMELWRAQAVQLVLLAVALTLLMVILFFQDWLVVRKEMFQRLRIGYLLFTVFFLGFYAKAQLSVINLLAFLRVLFGGFTWDTLLIDPMIFMLWGFVAVSIIFWGRGVFCGWLCPFGALQELIHKVAERLPLANFEFPPMVHERLWAIKYFILIALVGLSLESMVYAARLAEVEPFKTTFVMRFNRELWFVGYAWLLLLISVFNSKFYCKYLCPLGAGLSFFTRFRIFDWLRRRPDCGSTCQSCATQCQISAIKPTGEIIDNECHYCLECQVTYWDEHRCPPLVEKRKKREKRENRQQGIIASDERKD